jgi:hypothetical protein
MALFFVTYDLIKYKDYPRLWERLGQYGAQRVLLSVWVLRSNSSASAIRDDLMNFVDKDDCLLVVQSSDWASFNTMININQF